MLGDFIVVGSEMGKVEYIGLKTTRLRSLSGEQLVFSNTDLLKSRIHNYKRMSERRVLFTVGVEYDTPADKVAAIPAMLRAAVEAQEPVRFDRAHFARFGDSALIFEVVYYVLAADYNTLHGRAAGDQPGAAPPLRRGKDRLRLPHADDLSPPARVTA